MNFSLSWETIGLCILATAFVGLITYAVMVCVNAYKVKDVLTNKEKLLFYDLKPFWYDEYEEEPMWKNLRTFAELNEYRLAKKEGRKAVLTESVRNRFVPVTMKSVAVLTFLQFIETAGTIIILVFALGLSTVALFFFGTPL